VSRKSSKFVKFNAAALAILASVLLGSGAASAKDRKPKGSDNNQAHVVGHISFAGLSAIDMAMQKKGNDRYYLYVQHSNDQGISIVDISKPAQPRAVGVIPWSDAAVSGRMSVTGDLAVIAESEALPVRGGRSDHDLVVWDLSNPASPRVVQKFSGVVKWLHDERDFIYVLNGDGLWVVSEPADSQAKQTESTSSYGGEQ
jgi:hypothetical protein